MHGWSPVRGFCDGSPQSECNRAEDSNCLLSAANDKHLDVMGNTLSGWLGKFFLLVFFSKMLGPNYPRSRPRSNKTIAITLFL
jgi:hypothetical protein